MAKKEEEPKPYLVRRIKSNAANSREAIEECCNDCAGNGYRLIHVGESNPEYYDLFFVLAGAPSTDGD